MSEWTIDWTVTTTEGEPLADTDVDKVALKPEVSRYADLVDGATIEDDQHDLVVRLGDS